MNCPNVLCRKRTHIQQSGCLIHNDEQVSDCLQYNLYNEVVLQTERKTTATFSDIIHDAANQVQKENF